MKGIRKFNEEDSYDRTIEWLDEHRDEIEKIVEEVYAENSEWIVEYFITEYIKDCDEFDCLYREVLQEYICSSSGRFYDELNYWIERYDEMVNETIKWRNEMFYIIEEAKNEIEFDYDAFYNYMLNFIYETDRHDIERLYDYVEELRERYKDYCENDEKWWEGY